MATKFTQEEKFVRCVHDGSYAYDEFREVVKAAAAYCRECGARNLLLDFSRAQGDLSFYDRYKLGEESPALVGFGLRVAVYGRPDQIHPEKIGELVARNRGAAVRVFADPAKAEAWIRSEGS